MKNITTFFRKIFYGIENLIIYFPVIWNDSQWDHYFFFKILNKKLELMNKYWHSDYPMIVKSHQDKIAKDIKTAYLISQRIIDNNYSNNVFHFHDKKWGELNHSLKSGIFNLKRENVITKEDERNESREFRNLMKHYEYLQKQDIEYLFKLLNKKIRSWWD